MNYSEYNIHIGTETFIQGEGSTVEEIEFGFFKNGIPFKIVKLK